MTKFEQLLDYIVNEEHDKANELFHEIVVEKSREIYENLIAEEDEMDEAADDEEADESVDEAADEEMDEAAEDDEELDEAADEEMDEGEDEEADESMDLEDSYMMDGDDEEPMGGMDDMGGDATDDLEGDVSADSPEEELKMSIKNAMAELQAAFDAAEDMSGGDMGGDDEFAAGDDDMGDEMPKEDDMMGFMEGRRMTREYVEKVGNDWDKGSSQKAQAKHVGAGSGDTDSAPNEGRSPISSGSGKPTTGAHAKNLNQHHSETAPDGTTPHGKAGGFLSGAKDMGTGNGNVPGGKMGVKNLKKVSGGHGAEKKGSGPGPVGSGTGDKAGQTSMGNQAQLIKHIK